MHKKRPISQTFTLPFSVPLRLIYMRFATFIWVGITLIFLGVSVYNPAPLDRVKMTITDLTAPLLQTASKPFMTLSENINGVTEIGKLRAENIRLSEENARLKEWYQTALTLQAENQSLRDFLNVQAEADRTYLTTRILSDSNGRFVKSFLVPAGHQDGVKKGQAVITESGLIGRIVSTGKNTARVLLITDLNSRIPVMIEDTKHRAVLGGQNDKNLILHHYQKDSGISIGARIVTSGHDGILPANIPIGIITDIDHDIIYVTPLADMERIHYVQIINSENHDISEKRLVQ